MALEKGPCRLKEDHDNARFLADQLAGLGGIEIDPGKVRTNIVIYGVSGAGFDSDSFLSELESRGVLAVGVDRQRIRMVTHLDVTRNQVEQAMGVITEVVEERMQ